MNDLDSLMPRVIEQIYNVLAHEIKTGLWDGRDESGGIYSFQFLQSLHEDYMINLHKLLEMTNFQFDEAINQDNNILSKYLALMNAKKSQLTQKWLTLRHFIIYIYRSSLSLNPLPDSKEISAHFLAEIKSLVKELSKADETQLYLRIFSLLHTFVSFTFCQFNKSIADKGKTLNRLYEYYQTFLVASKVIYPAFMDLEKLLQDKSNMTWMDYNKFIFFNIFYQAIDSEILTKIREMGELEYPSVCKSMIIDFGELNTIWQTLKKLRMISQNVDEMSEDHKLILKNNFWIHRNKDKQNVQRLAVELIILASDRRTRNCEPYLNREGQCLCEDCLLCMIALQVDLKKVPASFKLLPCHFCPKGVELNQFHDHVVGHLKQNVSPDVIEPTLKEKVLDKVNIQKTLDDTESKEIKNGMKKSQSLLSLLKKVKPTKTETDAENTGNKLTEKKVDNSSCEDSKENSRVPYIRNEATNKNTSACSHSCKHEEELKAELKKLQGTAPPNKKHTNETRTRLRIRLNQRNQRQKTVPVESSNKISSNNTTVSAKTAPPKFEPTLRVETQQNTKAPNIKIAPKFVETNGRGTKVQLEPIKSNLVPKTGENKLNDIHGLIDYIEGNSGSDKAAIAEKKAAKKARQRQRKEEEKKKIDDEKIMREEEQKRKAELQLRLSQQITDKNKKNEVNKKSKKSKNSKNLNGNSSVLDDGAVVSDLIEETIPATVTISKSTENGENRPTVTITLKGSTPDQDRLLYTLMNSQLDINKDQITNKSKKNKKSTSSQQKLEQLVKVQVTRKEYGNSNNGKLNNSNNKEVKVSFTVNNKLNDNFKKMDMEKSKIQPKPENVKSKELDLPFLKLPPGITITKIDGPTSNKNNYRISMNDVPGNTNVPINKSGVIVVDTEKLINSNEKDSNRKGKKKKNKKQQQKSTTATATVSQQPSMVTLKNPIFQSLTESIGRPSAMPIEIAGASCGQASIFRNENGMVTIRSSRLQQSINNGIPMHNILSDLKPVIGGEVDTVVSDNFVTPKENTMSSLNAQEILSGLPGIEITKVNKKFLKPELDTKANQIAQVSIIPTNGDKSHFDKDDWSYDNIFTPKDVLEDDLDAEERELEAFKRFCQQSVPPKQKEKVAHLNVHDIVLKKKNDTNLA